MEPMRKRLSKRASNASPRGGATLGGGGGGGGGGGITFGDPPLKIGKKLFTKGFEPLTSCVKGMIFNHRHP